MAEIAIGPSDKLRAIRGLLRRTDMSITGRMVAAYLVDRYNPRTGQCNPGESTIMADLGLGRTSVYRAIREVIDARLFERDSGGGRGNRTKYKPNLAALFGISTTLGEGGHGSVKSVREGAHNHAEPIHESEHNGTQTVRENGQKRPLQRTQTVRHSGRELRKEIIKEQAGPRPPEGDRRVPSRVVPPYRLQGNRAEPSLQAIAIAKGSIRLALKGFQEPKLKQAIGHMTDTDWTILIKEIAMMSPDARPNWDRFWLEGHIRHRIVELAAERRAVP